MALDYGGKIQALQVSLAHVRAKQSGTFSTLAVALAIFGVLCLTAYIRRAAPYWLPPLTLPALVIVFQKHVQNRSEVRKLSRLCRFYEAGVHRLEGTWQGKGNPGDNYTREGHLYERDLNILGTGSLFELLCTARTEVGQRRLAAYLLDPSERHESLDRQAAVQELRSRTDLREATCLLGDYSFRGCEWEPFDEWRESPAVTFPRLISWILLVISCALGPLGLLLFVMRPDVGASLWTQVAPFLLPLLLILIVIGFMLQGRLRPALAGVSRIGQEFEVLRQGLQLLEKQTFTSAMLVRLVGRAKQGGGAASAIRRLERLIRALEDCEQPWFYALSRVLVVNTQLGLAIERWKARHREDLKIWLEAWSEFEALNALGCYAYEHPDDSFPELLDGVAEFEAAALGHPLLLRSICVPSEVHLNSTSKFYLISGSNMAGKSTFLRAIGTNAVLAAAGAPVRALRARLSCFAVCASISIVDSLGEGKSKFLAEVERLKETLAATSGSKPVLFLIDEILSGTNSRDRRVAAESFIRALVGAGAVGALSTHDLALAEIAERGELSGANVHMESQNPADPFAFDYRLKAGVSTQSNGLAIARLAGVCI